MTAARFQCPQDAQPSTKLTISGVWGSVTNKRFCGTGRAVVPRKQAFLYKKALLANSVLFDRNKYRDRRAADFARSDRQCAVAHHFKAFTDVVERYMRLVVVDFTEAGT